MLLKLRIGINKIRKKFHDSITDFRVIKICMLLVIPGYIGLVFGGVIIAALLDPDGYTLIDNMISDLGGMAHTPAPYLYDIACILAGAFTLPVTFYLEKLLIPIPSKPEDYNKTTRLRYRLGSYAFLCSIIGNIGYIGVGIFSEDRDPTVFGLIGAHGLMSSLAFGGFVLGAFFLGMVVFLYDTGIPKSLGVYGIFGPMLTLIIYVVIGSALWEWFLLFSILGWIIPLGLVIMAKEELQLTSR